MDVNVALDNQIRRLRRRVRLLLCERYALYGATAGAVLATVTVLLSYRYDDLINYRLWAGTVLAGAIVGVACGLLRRLSDLSVALAADKRTELKERLSSAVACGAEPGPGDMERALVTDAGEHISQFRPAQVFRRRFGTPHWAFAIAAVLLLAAIIVPQFHTFQSKTRREEVAVMKREGAKLVKLAKDLKSQKIQHQEMRKLAARLQKLGEKMQTGRMSRKQALLKTRRLGKDIKKQQDELAKQNSTTKSLERARADMRRESERLAASIARKMARQGNIPPEEALKKVPSDKQLAQLARKDGPLTESEQRELEQALEKYADPNSSMAIPAELGEALAKLAQNKDYQKAAELMQKLAQKLNTGNMSQADREMLEQQLQKLAEALKNTDLDKLAKAMLESAQKLANMSPEELQKMLDEMKKMQQMCQALAKAGGG